MKCPRCGAEMTPDNHRKYTLNMCYACGNIDGLIDKPIQNRDTNFKRLKTMNFNETAAFMSRELGIDKDKLVDWLTQEVDEEDKP